MKWTNTILIQTVWELKNNAMPDKEYITLFMNKNARLVVEDNKLNVTYEEIVKPDWLEGELVHLEIVNLNSLLVINERAKDSQEEDSEGKVETTP